MYCHRSGFLFLQVRCGVRNLADVNYKIMLRLIAYIFTNDKWYNSVVVHDKLEAWYWSAVFSGEYDKDQNDRYESNLNSMLESLKSSKRGYAWINTLKDKILDVPYFSECSFLLMEKEWKTECPKNIWGSIFVNFICQDLIQI